MSDYTDYLSRTKKFSNTEFSALPRNADGDIIQLATAYLWLTKSQEAKLSEDDSSRLVELNEEMEWMIAECVAEFS